jgi:hypothetical protein
MYTTIEADIDDGFIRASDASRLPKHAHVLITLLSSPASSTDEKRIHIPHPDLKHSIEVCGDLINTVPLGNWDLPQ